MPCYFEICSMWHQNIFQHSDARRDLVSSMSSIADRAEFRVTPKQTKTKTKPEQRHTKHNVIMIWKSPSMSSECSSPLNWYKNININTDKLYQSRKNKQKRKKIKNREEKCLNLCVCTVFHMHNS